MSHSTGVTRVRKPASSAPTVAGRRLRAGQPLALLATLVLIAAVVATAHWPVLRSQATSFDDNDYVLANPLVMHPGWASTSRFFREVLDPSTVKGYYLPLSMTSLMADVAMGGRAGDLRVFHRTNLVLHLVATTLVVLILYRLFGSLLAAAAAGLLFGLHPLTVEPVAWIGERKTLLAALFAFASVLCYVEHVRRRSRAWLGSSVALFLLALLSKPTVTPLPLLLLLLDGWPLRRLKVRAVVEKWPFFLLSVASGVVTLLSQGRTAGVAHSTGMDVLLWPVQAGYLLVVYLQQIAWPTNLACVYPLPPGFFTRVGPETLLGFAGACVLTGLLVFSARWTPGPLVGWLFFAGSIAPTMGLVKYSWMAASDKYVYFPALGILMVVASGLSAAWSPRRARGLARTTLQLLPVALILAAEWRGVRTALLKWTDSLTLARHMVAGAPESSHTHLILGVVLAQQGRAEESVQHLRIAAEFAPDDFETVYSLGNSLRLAGRLGEAEAMFRRALTLQPDSFGALDQLGTVLLFQGRAAESVEQFRKALALVPGNSIMRYRLAVALLSLGGHAAEAEGHLRQVIQARPDSPAPIGNLAWLLATSPDPTIRDPGEALRLAGRVVELTRSRDPRALETLAAAQAAAGRFDDAVLTARRALELAQSHRDDERVRGIRERLALYQRRVAYTEPEPAAPRPGR